MSDELIVTIAMVEAGERACDAMMAADISGMGGLGGSRSTEDLTEYEKKFLNRDTSSVEEIYRAMVEASNG